MSEQQLIDIIAEALLASDKINYVVRIQNGKGLQVQTSGERHYNIMPADVDRIGGYVVKGNRQRR